MKLTQEQLEAIRQRAENTTPGPWHARTSIGVCRDCRNVYEVIKEVDESEIVFLPPVVAELKSKDDANFIAHARTDIPALLDHIAELEAEIKRLHEYYYEKLGEASAREIELKAEVDYNYEKVRELYAWAKSSRDKFAKDDDYTKADARVDGILLTLEALGIKIEGVND